MLPPHLGRQDLRSWAFVQAEPIKIVTEMPFRQCAFLLRAQLLCPPPLQFTDGSCFVLLTQGWGWLETKPPDAVGSFPEISAFTMLLAPPGPGSTSPLSIALVFLIDTGKLLRTQAFIAWVGRECTKVWITCLIIWKRPWIPFGIGYAVRTTHTEWISNNSDANLPLKSAQNASWNPMGVEPIHWELAHIEPAHVLVVQIRNGL